MQMEMQGLKTALIGKIREYQNAAFALSDQMAREPELGGEEFKSSAAIVQLLRNSGIEVEYPFAGIPTAFCGRIAPPAGTAPAAAAACWRRWLSMRCGTSIPSAWTSSGRRTRNSGD